MSVKSTTRMETEGTHLTGTNQHPPRTIVTVASPSPSSPDSVFDDENDVVPALPVDMAPKGETRPSRSSTGTTSGLFDELFTQAMEMETSVTRRNSVSGTQGLQVDQVNQEWRRRESRGSVRSIRSGKSSLGGSLRSHSGSMRQSKKRMFLGVNTESTWTRWSRERRASFQRRAKQLYRQGEVLARVSTPVRKARQEGLKFVHPDLEGKFFSEEDLEELRRHKQRKFHAIWVIEKDRKSRFRFRTEMHLSAEQKQIISDFWEHPVFVRARCWGLFFVLVSFAALTMSMLHSHWISYENWNLTVYEGLWGNCNLPFPVLPPRQHVHSRVCLLLEGKDWQKAVIGLMLLAASLSVLGCLFSTCGLCAGVLPRRVYYLHSAGELFCVCALSTGVALTLFTVAVRTDFQPHPLPSNPPPQNHPPPHPHHNHHPHHQHHQHHQQHNNHHHNNNQLQLQPQYKYVYGLGYYLGWGGTFSFLVAAVLLSLDNIVQEIARCKCCRKYCFRVPCWNLPPGEEGAAISPGLPAGVGAGAGGANGGRDTELKML